VEGLDGHAREDLHEGVVGDVVLSLHALLRVREFRAAGRKGENAANTVRDVRGCASAPCARAEEAGEAYRPLGKARLDGRRLRRPVACRGEPMTGSI
jgi:hypothetical protein